MSRGSEVMALMRPSPLLAESTGMLEKSIPQFHATDLKSMLEKIR